MTDRRDDPPGDPGETTAPGAAARRGWLFGAAALLALIVAALHFSDLERVTEMARRARPAWLVLALALQLLTYLALARGWQAVLTVAGTPVPLGRLVRVAVAKLFADQMIPSAGMGGNVVLVDRLVALGVSRGTAVAALLVSMIGYYAAYALLALVMLVVLWLHDRATPLLVGLVTSFLLVAIAIPALALWLRARGSRPLPPRLEGLPLLRTLLRIVGEAPRALVADRRLIATVMACNAAVLLADAATLAVCLHALGQPLAPATAFVALMAASIVVTLGPIPMGLGSFEATATATLTMLGVGFEPAVAATLLFRGLALWLPLLPGLLLFRAAGAYPGRKRGEGR